VNNGVQTVKIQRYKIADTLMTEFYLHDGLQQKLRQRQMTLLIVVYKSLSVITSLSNSQTDNKVILLTLHDLVSVVMKVIVF